MTLSHSEVPCRFPRHRSHDAGSETFPLDLHSTSAILLSWEPSLTIINKYYIPPGLIEPQEIRYM